jgi:hypothetical protein
LTGSADNNATEAAEERLGANRRQPIDNLLFGKHANPVTMT